MGLEGVARGLEEGAMLLEAAWSMELAGEGAREEAQEETLVEVILSV